MWVSVGDVEFSAEEIAQRAVKSAAVKEVGGGNGIEDFGKLVRSKRFLLVLDDVWNEDRNKWNDLENIWGDDSASGSRVLLTTRSSIVARMTGNRSPYQLGYLSFEHSCSMFKAIVFGEKEVPNKEVEENIEKIVKKCGGVPLAIKTIANLLYFLNPETEWLPYITNQISKYPQANNNIFPTLELSYHHLPSPLKYCLAYCKIFPKGYEIYTGFLIDLWIAHGYVKASEMDNQSLEDIGKQYCKILLARSFFENEVVDESGDIASFKMHDIMHELVSYIGNGDIVFSYPLGKNVNKNTRHLSYVTHLPWLDGGLDSLLEARKLRTFISTWNDELSKAGNHKIEALECRKMLKQLKSLVVLQLQYSDLEIKIPSFFHSPFKASIKRCIKWARPDHALSPIGKLKHLRYLDLSCSYIKELPNSMSKLHNLQVLNISWCSEIKKLPKDIKWLVNLRILDCWGCFGLTYMPCGIKYLTSLHTLSLFVFPDDSKPCKHKAGLEELKNLSLLKSLAMRNLGHVKYDHLASAGLNLKEKKHLRSLTLSWDDSDYSADYNESTLRKFEPAVTLKELQIETYQACAHLLEEKLPKFYEELRKVQKNKLLDVEGETVNQEFLPKKKKGKLLLPGM